MKRLLLLAALTGVLLVPNYAHGPSLPPAVDEDAVNPWNPPPPPPPPPPSVTCPPMPASYCGG